MMACWKTSRADWNFPEVTSFCPDFTNSVRLDSLNRIIGEIWLFGESSLKSLYPSEIRGRSTLGPSEKLGRL